MTERYTLDTNILVYAVERNEGRKHELAVELVRRSAGGPCVLTVQALAEFVAVFGRKRPDERPFALAQTRDWLSLFPVTGPDKEALQNALHVLESGRASLWDGLLLATARGAGCTIALSEDMQDGSTILGIAVRNPFRAGGLPEDLRPLLGMA